MASLTLKTLVASITVIALMPNLGWCQSSDQPGFTDKEHAFLNSMLLEGAVEVPELRTHALAIPLKLQNAGLGKIKVGSHSLDKIVAKIEKTKFKENSSFVATAAKGTLRYSAFYDPKSNSLVLNSTVAPVIYPIGHSPEEAQMVYEQQAQPLLLHEALGANKVNDTKYDKSLGLYFLSQPEQSGARLNRSQTLEAINPILKSGGVTIVGGGGDYVGMQIKRILIDTALFSGSRADQEICLSMPADRLLKKLLELEIEFNPRRYSFGSESQLNFNLEYIAQKNLVQFDRLAWTHAVHGLRNIPQTEHAVRTLLKTLCN